MKATAERTTAMAAAHARDGGRCLMCGRRTDAPGHHLFVGEDRLIRANRADAADAIATLCLECHARAHGWGREQVLAWLNGLRRTWRRAYAFPFDRVLGYYKAKYAGSRDGND